MFLAVAAGVIGGTSLAGGSGTIIGGLVGAIVLAVLRDGFTLQGINAFTFDIIIGARDPDRDGLPMCRLARLRPDRAGAHRASDQEPSCRPRTSSSGSAP